MLREAVAVHKKTDIFKSVDGNNKCYGKVVTRKWLETRL